MNQPRDPDPIIATWLDDGPIDLPAETRRAIAVGLRTQPRARRMAILRGSPMYPFTRLVDRGGHRARRRRRLGIFALSNRERRRPRRPLDGFAGAVGLACRRRAVAVARAVTDGVSPSTAGWVTFTSTRYGYQIEHPPTWTATPATRAWVLATDRWDRRHRDERVGGSPGRSFDGGRLERRSR